MVPAGDAHRRPAPRSSGRSPGRTMPENLQDAGVSWKVYQDAAAPDPAEPVAVLQELRRLMRRSSARTGQRALNPSLPGGVRRRRDGGNPAVGLVGRSADSPPAITPPPRPRSARSSSAQVLETLVGNPAVWANTALVISYDENGGFFDHVPHRPSTPRRRRVSTSRSTRCPRPPAGLAGPIGLGFRVPCLVVSPFTPRWVPLLGDL